jgi:hypothetical protein
MIIRTNVAYPGVWSANGDLDRLRIPIAARRPAQVMWRAPDVFNMAALQVLKRYILTAWVRYLPISPTITSDSERFPAKY